MAALAISCGVRSCSALSTCQTFVGIKALAVAAEFFLSEIFTVVPPPIASALSAYRAVLADIEAALKADVATLLANDAFLKESSLDASARKDYVSARAYRAQFQATEAPGRRRRPSSSARRTRFSRTSSAPRRPHRLRPLTLAF